MGKEDEKEVARLTPEMKAQIDAGKGGKQPINPGAEVKPGYSEMISRFEQKAGFARDDANEVSRDAGKEADLERAGKSSGVSVGIGLGVSNNGDGWKFGFVSPGESKRDKYHDAADKEGAAQEEITSLKRLANMKDVDVKDVKQLVDKNKNPSEIEEAIRAGRKDGKSPKEAMDALKKEVDLSSVPNAAMSEAAQLAKNSFGGQGLEHRTDGTTVNPTSPNLATNTPTHTV